MPDLKVPEWWCGNKCEILEDAMKHCAPVIDKSAPGVRGGINLRSIRMAVPSAGVSKFLRRKICSTVNRLCKRL